MDIILILNDSPYGTERSYNGLRLANSLLDRGEEVRVTVFLLGDGVYCAKRGQDVPDGRPNVGRMLERVAREGQLLACGTCMRSRGIEDGDLVERCRRSTIGELNALALDADKALVF
jgi:uncharacterized protein involved in oxidation of intracellular sulfur